MKKAICIEVHAYINVANCLVDSIDIFGLEEEKYEILDEDVQYKDLEENINYQELLQKGKIQPVTCSKIGTVVITPKGIESLWKIENANQASRLVEALSSIKKQGRLRSLTTVKHFGMKTFVGPEHGAYYSCVREKLGEMGYEVRKHYQMSVMRTSEQQYKEDKDNKQNIIEIL